MSAAQRVRIELGRSRLLALLLAAAHIGTLAVILIVTLPVWAMVLATSLIVASGAWSISHVALLRAVHSIVELEVGEGGRASCRRRDGVWHKAQVLESSFIAPWLTVLNLRVEGLRPVRHVVILADGVEADAFRRLRVLLRWSPPVAGSQSDPVNNRG